MENREIRRKSVNKKQGQRPQGAGRSRAEEVSRRRRVKTRHRQRELYHEYQDGDSSAVIRIVAIAMAVIILIILGYGIYRLVKWDKSAVSSGYDPNSTSDEFDVEAEDYLQPLNSEMEALQKKDGVNNILLLGNGIAAKSKGQSNSMAGLIAEKTGGQVIDATIDNSFISIKNLEFDESYPTDLFSFYWIALSYMMKEFGPVKTYAETWDGDAHIKETVETLSGLDVTEIDTIILMYDHSDYMEGRVMQTPSDHESPYSSSGGLYMGISFLKQAMPQARIIVSSPYFVMVEDESGQSVSSGEYVINEGNLGEYMISYKNMAVDAGVSFIDNYFGTISADNYEEYLEPDEYRYPNEKGMDILAERIAYFVGK